MAKQIEGVYEKILHCAKAEFLSKGYNDASLRTIAENANTSTSSIYTRFSDKEGLFNALVSPVVLEIKEWFLKAQEDFHYLPNEYQKKDLFNYCDDKTTELIDYIYDNYDVFKLLITCSYGTRFNSFVNDLVQIEVDYTKKFIESTGNDAIKSGRLTEEIMHILASAFYTGIFETIIHDMSRENAHIYIKQLRRFFTCGWSDIFNTEN